ncbi:hypothetical protein KCU86_g54, partial [Aureobasidium melanogenum]
MLSIFTRGVYKPVGFACPSAFRLKTSFRLTSVSIPVTYLSLELNRRTHTNTALQNSESRHKPPQLYQSYAPLVHGLESVK